MEGLSILTIPTPDNMSCANESIFLVAYNIHRERRESYHFYTVGCVNILAHISQHLNFYEFSASFSKD